MESPSKRLRVLWVWSVRTLRSRAIGPTSSTSQVPSPMSPLAADFWPRTTPHLIARMRVCILMLSLVSCSTIYQASETKATLWKLRGDHNTLYLLGSVHVLSQKSYPLKPALNRAFDDSKCVVFEIDLSHFTKTNFQREFRRTALY